MAADRAGERGSATIWGIGWMAVCASLAAVITCAAVCTAEQHAVDGAADLAAVAAAAALQSGHDGCAAAAVTASANRAVLVGCTVDVERVEVRTSLQAPLPFALSLTVIGRSRAGPDP
jgi:secretion/DNA translocation related TadE-like protein